MGNLVGCRLAGPGSGGLMNRTLLCCGLPQTMSGAESVSGTRHVLGVTYCTVWLPDISCHRYKFAAVVMCRTALTPCGTMCVLVHLVHLLPSTLPTSSVGLLLRH